MLYNNNFRVLIIALLALIISGCSATIPKQIELVSESNVEINQPSIVLSDQRPVHQKSYRSPVEMKDTIHGLGDNSFTIPPLEYLSRVINKNHRKLNKAHKVVISSLEIQIYDPGVSIELTPAEKASVAQFGPGGAGLATLFQSMMASSSKKRYMFIALEYNEDGKVKVIENDGYIVQSSIHKDIEEVLESIALELSDSLM